MPENEKQGVTSMGNCDIVKRVDAQGMDYKTLGEAIRAAGERCVVDNCLGQRFIGAGMSGTHIDLNGTPGNALGAYLSGAELVVHGNAQDAVGDTMDSGRIVIHGNVGDAAGYAMRGGEIYVRGSAGYRTGIHMKAYRDKKPVIVIGGRAGSFLGEYQAGGLILVLGLHTDGHPLTGYFPGTGMHGGKLILRGELQAERFPGQTSLHEATPEDMDEVAPYLQRFCALFGYDMNELLRGRFTVVTPNSSNPYKQMYVAN